jgi:hypothetical protein
MPGESRRRGWIGPLVWLLAAATVGVLIWRELTSPQVRSGSAVAPEPPPSRPALDAATPSDVLPDVLAPADAPAPSIAPLYTVTEALDDVLSGPLVFVGTGEWFGNYSIHACAYRNARVLVVNVYCTAKETPAFGLVVLSPSRGRVNVYAEAETAISTLARADYNTFRVEAQVAVEEPLALSFTYAELRAWDERRYNVYAPACWVETGATCPAELASLRAAWAPAGEGFVAAPPPEWYRLVKDLHTRAVRDSRK